VAVNCCVAPAGIFAVDGATDIDLSILGGGTLGELPPHPVFGITSKKERPQTGMDSKRRRRIAIYLITEEMRVRKTAGERQDPPRRDAKDTYHTSTHTTPQSRF
jgi:hypothetical protein